MRKIVLATAFILTSSVAFAAPFTAEISGDGAQSIRGFQSVAQCQAYIAGVGGTCVDNGSSWTSAQARLLSPVKSPVVVETYNPNQP